MATVDLTCPDCGTDMHLQARALLATIDLTEPWDLLGSLSWICASCDELITAEIELTGLLPLLSAGVLLVHDAAAARADGDSLLAGSDPRAPAVDRYGDPPLTADDLVALRELLDAEDWLNQLGGAGEGT